MLLPIQIQAFYERAEILSDRVAATCLEIFTLKSEEKWEIIDSSQLLKSFFCWNWTWRVCFRAPSSDTHADVTYWYLCGKKKRIGSWNKKFFRYNNKNNVCKQWYPQLPIAGYFRL